MLRKRIGNDLPFQWHIFRNGEPEDLTEGEVKVLLRDQCDKVCPFEYTLAGNEVRAVFYAKDQRRIGIYSLLLTKIAESGVVTVDECQAFELVPHTCMEGGGPDVAINGEMVIMSTNITHNPVFVPGDGPSDYEARLADLEKRLSAQEQLNGTQQEQIDKNTEVNEAQEEKINNGLQIAAIEEIEGMFS